MITTCEKCGGLKADPGEMYAGRGCECPPEQPTTPPKLEGPAPLCSTGIVMPPLGDATEQLRREINNMITRYGAESELTAAQAFGVLEICKLDLAERLRED